MIQNKKMKAIVYEKYGYHWENTIGKSINHELRRQAEQRMSDNYNKIINELYRRNEF